MAVLADTGFLFAVLDGDDRQHGAALELLQSSRESFLVPAVVLPEVCYLAHKYLGAEAERSFLEGLLGGDMLIEWGEAADLGRAVEILEARPEFGLVDASVMAAAERLGIRRVATFDRRHFGSFRPAHCAGFELLP